MKKQIILALIFVVSSAAFAKSRKNDPNVSEESHKSIVKTSACLEHGGVITQDYRYNVCDGGKYDGFITGGSVPGIDEALTAAEEMKKEDIRTLVKQVENKEGNPCLPEGKSLIVELQVKQAYFDRVKKQVLYSWQTVKTIGFDKDGHIQQVCAE